MWAIGGLGQKSPSGPWLHLGIAAYSSGEGREAVPSKKTKLLFFSNVCPYRTISMLEASASDPSPGCRAQKPIRAPEDVKQKETVHRDREELDDS
jgi:hypothetical protein